MMNDMDSGLQNIETKEVLDGMECRTILRINYLISTGQIEYTVTHLERAIMRTLTECNQDHFLKMHFRYFYCTDLLTQILNIWPRQIQF